MKEPFQVPENEHRRQTDSQWQRSPRLFNREHSRGLPSSFWFVRPSSFWVCFYARFYAYFSGDPFNAYVNSNISCPRPKPPCPVGSHWVLASDWDRWEEIWEVEAIQELAIYLCRSNRFQRSVPIALPIFGRQTGTIERDRLAYFPV